MTILQMIEEMQMRVDNFSSAAHDATFVKTGIIVQPTFPVRASQEAHNQFSRNDQSEAGEY